MSEHPHPNTDVEDVDLSDIGPADGSPLISKRAAAPNLLVAPDGIRPSKALLDRLRASPGSYFQVGWSKKARMLTLAVCDEFVGHARPLHQNGLIFNAEVWRLLRELELKPRAVGGTRYRLPLTAFDSKHDIAGFSLTEEALADE